MSEITIYHNPRCSKSRASLALLEDNGIVPEIVLYQESPLNRATLSTLLTKLDMKASELVRRGEADFKEAGLSRASTEQEVLEAMVERPKLIERPIVVKGDRAVLGKPPENVLELVG